MTAAAARVTRDFSFKRNARSWTVNGRDFDPSRPLASPRLGDVEVWRVVTDFHHSLHIHLAHLQVFSRNDRPPCPYDSGWKDTVDIRPAEAVAVIARFTGYPGRYVMHCHNLEHEDMAMMAIIMVALTQRLGVARNCPQCDFSAGSMRCAGTFDN